ncbi:MAG: hypothetical protein NVSMB2_27040 [Chloroflexota bacterium]
MDRLAITRVLLSAFALVFGMLAPNAMAGAENLPNDERTTAALTLLDGTPATSQLRDVLDANRVSIRFAPMAAGVYARYSVARHVIEVDDRWADSDVVTLAAVLAHESTHAQDAVSGYLSAGGSAACIDSEVRAFRTSALFWLDHYGPAGKPGELTELDRQLNSIAEREVRDPGGLEDLVRQTYLQQCAH